MAKFPLYQWKKTTGSGDIDTSNLAKLNRSNEFSTKQIITATGDILTIRRSDSNSFGIDLLSETNDRLAFFGTRQSYGNNATVWGKNGLALQSTGGDVNILSYQHDFRWDSSRNWNQNVDNTITKTKDFKFVKKFDYTSVAQPTTNWNTTSWNWTLPNLNSQQGFHEFLIVVSINNVVYSLNSKIVWKSGLAESKSPILTISHNDNTYDFQLVIKTNNKFFIYNKKSGGSDNIQWVRGWIIRDNNLPWKPNQLW